MPQQHLLFQIEAEDGPDAYVIRLQGELDMAGCPALERALIEAEQSQADRILLDLEELAFVDGSGLNVLWEAGHRSAQNGDRLQITPGKGQVAEIFRFTALDTALPIADSRPDEIGGASPDGSVSV